MFNREDLAVKLIERDNEVEQVPGVANVILGDPIFDSDEHQAIMALPITISYIATIPIYLTDGSGNRLTDEDGNYLTED